MCLLGFKIKLAIAVFTNNHLFNPKSSQVCTKIAKLSITQHELSR